MQIACASFARLSLSTLVSAAPTGPWSKVQSHAGNDAAEGLLPAALAAATNVMSAHNLRLPA